MKTDSIRQIFEASDESVEEITSLTINRFDINGDFAEVDFTELLQFKSLERLVLKNLIIGMKEFSIIENLYNLKYLKLINCEWNIEDKLRNIELNEIVLDNTEVNPMIFSNHLNRIVMINMNMDYSGLKTDILDLSRASININTIPFEVINTLIVSEKQFIENKEMLLNRKTHLLVKDDLLDKVVEEYENY